MASTIQIVPKYSFPGYIETYVNDNTQVVETDQEVYTDPSTSHIFVFRSSKGIDNVFVKKNTVQDFTTTFGQSNFKEYGQPLMMPLAALASPTSTGWCMRVMPENAAYAHKVINLHYLADVQNRKFYIKLVGNTSNESITTTDKLEEYAASTIPATGVDAEGFTVARFQTIRSAGRGKYGNNYSVRAAVNSTYEKEYGIKFYTYGINSKENNYKQIAAYVGSNVSTTKYSQNVFINDVIADTEVGVVPVVINVSEDSLREVYDAYIAFCEELNDTVLAEYLSKVSAERNTARDSYNVKATAFQTKYLVAPSDVIGTENLVVPAELVALNTTLEDATRRGNADEITAAQKAFDDYREAYIVDVSELRDAYNAWAENDSEFTSINAEKNLLVDSKGIPDFDEFDFIFGQVVNGTASHPFLQIITDDSVTRKTSATAGETVGTVDTSAFAENTFETIDTPFADYVEAYQGGTINAHVPRICATDEVLAGITTVQDIAGRGVPYYIIDSENQVYAIYVASHPTDPDVDEDLDGGTDFTIGDDDEVIETVWTLKWIELGEAKHTVETTTETDTALVGADEEIINFASTLGVSLTGGYDGYFADPRIERTIITTEGSNQGQMVEKQWTVEDEAAECYIKAFNGTYDRRILTAKRIDADAIFDANYPMSVKKTMFELVTVRNDCPLYLDTGIVSSYTEQTISKLEADFAEFGELDNSYLVSKNLQHYMIKEPSTGKRVTVTTTYYLASIFGNHFINVGFENPLVKDRCQLTGHIANSLEPSIEDYQSDLKQRLSDSRFNYFETIGDNIYQRATQTTAQVVESDLSEESNVLTLCTIKRGVESILNSRLYDFSDPTERTRVKRLIETTYASYVGTKVNSLNVEFAVTQWEADHSIIHCYLAIVFRGLDKRAIFEIDLNKRDNSSLTTTVLTEASN